METQIPKNGKVLSVCTMSASYSTDFHANANNELNELKENVVLWLIHMRRLFSLGYYVICWINGWVVTGYQVHTYNAYVIADSQWNNSYNEVAGPGTVCVCMCMA